MDCAHMNVAVRTLGKACPALMAFKIPFLVMNFAHMEVAVTTLAELFSANIAAEVPFLVV